MSAVLPHDSKSRIMVIEKRQGGTVIDSPVVGRCPLISLLPRCCSLRRWMMTDATVAGIGKSNSCRIWVLAASRIRGIVPNAHWQLVAL